MKRWPAIFILLLLSATAAIVISCKPEPVLPDQQPQIRGKVEGLTLSDNNLISPGLF